MRRPVPVDAKRKDWPRLVADAIGNAQNDIAAIQAGFVAKDAGASNWVAATGTLTRTTFDTTTVTTAQLAERVAALIDDLLANGSIK